MTLLDFLTNPWVVVWLGTGAVCALIMAVSAYRNGSLEPASTGSTTVWDAAVDRTVHAVALTLQFVLIAAAGPVFALALVFNCWTARLDAVSNEVADNADW
jgi:hypothetical protein